MSEARGESRASYFSQSQLSESTVLNQDFADIELFQPDVLAFKAGFYQPKAVRFAPSEKPDGSAPVANVPPLVLEKSSSLDSLGKKTLQGDFKGKTAELMSRLVDKPENSQVLQTMKPKMPQSRRKVSFTKNVLPSSTRSFGSLGSLTVVSCSVVWCFDFLFNTNI